MEGGQKLVWLQVVESARAGREGVVVAMVAVGVEEMMTEEGAGKLEGG